MFSRKFLLSLIFAIVVLCMSGPSVTVQAKEVSSVLTEDSKASTVVNNDISERRMLKSDSKDSDDDDDDDGGFDFFAFLISLIPFILQLFNIGDQPADDGRRA